jgi:hypothetical protein
VGRTSTAMEVGEEKEQARGVDPVMVGEAPTWTQWRWRRCVKADTKEERA